MTEPTVQVPVSLIERALTSMTTERYDNTAARALEVLLSQPTPIADPPRIEDMAPGTITSICPRCGGSGCVGLADCRLCAGTGVVSNPIPSTIRDVTPPPTTGPTP